MKRLRRLCSAPALLAAAAALALAGCTDPGLQDGGALLRPEALAPTATLQATPTDLACPGDADPVAGAEFGGLPLYAQRDGVLDMD
jgi:hypothetical protein